MRKTVILLTTLCIGVTIWAAPTEEKNQPCESIFSPFICKKYHEQERAYNLMEKAKSKAVMGYYFSDANVATTLSPEQQFIELKKNLKWQLYFWVRFLVALKLIRDIRPSGGSYPDRCNQRVEEAPYHVQLHLGRGMIGLLRLGYEVNGDPTM